jgi:hypothetical protein
MTEIEWMVVRRHVRGFLHVEVERLDNDVDVPIRLADSHGNRNREHAVRADLGPLLDVCHSSVPVSTS